MSLARKYRIVPTSSPWVSEDASTGATVKVVIPYLREEVLMTNKIDEKGQSIIRKIALKNWATVANANLGHKLLAPEFKDVLACEVANECKDCTKSLR